MRKADCMHLAIFSLVLLVSNFALGASGPATGTAPVTVSQPNATFVSIDTPFFFASFNTSHLEMSIKAPSGAKVPLYTKILEYFETVKWRVIGSAECHTNNTAFSVSQWTVFVEPQSIEGLYVVGGSSRFGIENACLLTMRFFVVDHPLTFEQNGKQIAMNTSTLKYSYEISNCSSYHHASVYANRTDLVVIGRAGGLALGISAQAPSVGDFLPRRYQDSPGKPIGDYWDDLCANYSDSSGPFAPLRGFSTPNMAGLNMDRPVSVGFDITDGNSFFQLDFAFQTWGYSDHTTYVYPGVPFALSQLVTTSGDGFATIFIPAYTRMEFHNNSEYDPSISVLFDPVQTTPASPVETQTGMIVGVTVGVSAAALIILVVILHPKLRHTVFPFLNRRDKESPRRLNDDSIADEPTSKPSKSGWQSANAPSKPL